MHGTMQQARASCFEGIDLQHVGLANHAFNFSQLLRHTCHNFRKSRIKLHYCPHDQQVSQEMSSTVLSFSTLPALADFCPMHLLEHIGRPRSYRFHTHELLQLGLEEWLPLIINPE
jgi:hypothetical protein